MICLLSAVNDGHGALIYVGGYDRSRVDHEKYMNTTERYDLEVGTWRPFAPLLSRRAGHGLVLSGGDLYCIGGFNVEQGRENRLTQNPPYGYLSSVERLSLRDPLAGWQPAPTMGIAREGAGTAVVSDGRIFVAGGRNTPGDRMNAPLASMEMLRPGDGHWEARAEMPRPRLGFAMAAVGDCVLAIGGADSKPERAGVGAKRFLGIGAVDAYSVREDRWYPAPPLNIPRHGHDVAVVGNRIMVAGGTTDGILAIASVLGACLSVIADDELTRLDH